MRTVIIALPVEDDADIFEVQEVIATVFPTNGDDSKDCNVYENVAALLNDLGIKVPKRFNAGRSAVVRVDHNARLVGSDDTWVPINQGDVVAVQEWFKPFGSYKCKAPTGQPVWIDPGDLMFFE